MIIKNDDELSMYIELLKDLKQDLAEYGDEGSPDGELEFEIDEMETSINVYVEENGGWSLYADTDDIGD